MNKALPPGIRVGRLLVHQDIAVWRVNGQLIRDRVDIEFSNYSQHYRFGFIPVDEFWIDHTVHPTELKYFVIRLMAEWQAMRSGTSYDDQWQSSVEAEQRARLEVRGPRLPNEDFLRAAGLRLFGRTEQGIAVRLVNGFVVRNQRYVDFAEGGHNSRYAFIPKDDIWLEDDVRPAERGFILVHELSEHQVMRGGWKYEAAHAHANKMELHARQHPAKLSTMLTRLGWSSSLI